MCPFQSLIIYCAKCVLNGSHRLCEVEDTESWALDFSPAPRESRHREIMVSIFILISV